MSESAVFEKSTLKLNLKLAKGTKPSAKVKVTFIHNLGGEDEKREEPVEAEVSKSWMNASARVEYQCPAVADGKDSYRLSYVLQVNDAPETAGSNQWVVWRKEIKLKFVADNDPTKAMGGTRFRALQDGSKILEPTANPDGTFTVALRKCTSATFEGVAPYEITGWTDTKDVGGDREAKVKRHWKAAIYTPVCAKPPLKQYVNLVTAQDGQDQLGSNVKVVVGSLGDKQATVDKRVSQQGDRVYVKATFSKKTKRTSEHALQDVDNHAEVENTDTALVVTGEVVIGDQGTGTFKVELGTVGGDTCKLEIGTTEDRSDASLEFVNWRKVNYQLSYPTGTTLPSLGRAEKAFAGAFLEFVQVEQRVFTTADGPAGSWIDGTQLGKSAGDFLIIGGHNSDDFRALFNHAGDDRCVHIQYCDSQCDAEYPAKNLDLDFTSDHKISWTGEAKKVYGRELSFSEYFNDDSWGVIATNLKDGGASTTATWVSSGGPNGDVPAGNIRHKWTDSSCGKVSLRLPPAAVTEVEGGETVTVSYVFECFKGPYLGESGRPPDGHQILIVSRQKANAINDTISHEVGHAMKMAPKAGAVPPGFGTLAEAHPKAYQGRGGQGSHCASGIPQTDFDGGGDLSDSLHAYCTMYHEDHSRPLGVSGKFCERCTPLLQARDLSRVRG